jgi:integrase/recombinase XerD
LAYEIAHYNPRQLTDSMAGLVPAVVTEAGDRATRRFLEFFTASIRNPNTRSAYYRAVRDFFYWCEKRHVPLEEVCPMLVAVYIEELGLHRAPPTVQQNLAAIRTLFDFLVIGQVVPFNPAASVRGPKYVVKKGKTPVLSAEDARLLLDSVDTSHVVGLRDRALIAVMTYSFARISAVVNMRVEDYYRNGKRWWFRLHEKGGKFHEVPAHHKAEAYLDSYLEVAGIATEAKLPLFRSTRGQSRRLTERHMGRRDALRMIKRRTAELGMTSRVCCHTFRATGITAYLQNNGSLEMAQAIAAHESPRTTKLYDRRQDQLTLDEIERIRI